MKVYRSSDVVFSEFGRFRRRIQRILPAFSEFFRHISGKILVSGKSNIPSLLARYCRFPMMALLLGLAMRNWKNRSIAMCWQTFVIETCMFQSHIHSKCYSPLWWQRPIKSMCKDWKLEPLDFEAFHSFHASKPHCEWQCNSHRSFHRPLKIYLEIHSDCN